MYLRFFEIRSCVSTSLAEPKDKFKKWAKSASVGRPAPSAMLLLIDTVARWS